MDEYNEYIYYYFTGMTEYPKNKVKPEFTLTIYSFEKLTGSYTNTKLTELKGTPSCISGGLTAI